MNVMCALLIDAEMTGGPNLSSDWTKEFVYEKTMVIEAHGPGAVAFTEPFRYLQSICLYYSCVLK